MKGLGYIYIYSPMASSKLCCYISSMAETLERYKSFSNCASEAAQPSNQTQVTDLFRLSYED